MTIERPKEGWTIQHITPHPGEILDEEFLKPLAISQRAFAMKIHIPAARFGEIVRGRRTITADTALRLARFFGNSPEFWMNLQQMHDLSKAMMKSRKTIEREVSVYAAP